MQNKKPVTRAKSSTLKPLAAKKKATKRKGMNTFSLEKKYLTPLLIVCALVFGIVAVSAILPSEEEITGEVFITTKGGANIRLGSVEVQLIPLKTMVSKLEENRVFAELEESVINANARGLNHRKNQGETDAAWRQEVEVITERYSAFKTGKHWFRTIAPSLRSVSTSSEGKFSIKVPKKGRFALYATTERQVSDNTEEYYWLELVSLKDGTEKVITLNNSNLCSPSSVKAFIEISKRIGL